MKKFLTENGRPDKPVACPRCNSFNTKFCYFNNYNVKQPRHFCRECQRYWTAGGSLRNVPVGAGRRKHKIASSKPYGSNTFTNNEGEVDECAYSSLKPYPSLPVKQLVGYSPDGTMQEIQGFKEVGLGDVVPMYGDERSRPAKFETDMTPDSKFSLGMKGYMQDTHVAERLGFSQVTQKRTREPTIDVKICKLKYEYGSGNPISTSTYGAHDGGPDDDGHAGDAPDNMHDPSCDDVQNDVGESAIRGVHEDVADTDAHVGMRKDLPAEHDDSTCCSSVTAAITSTSSEGVSETNGSSPMTHTLTSATTPTGIENQPPVWGPLMWPPWVWPFFLNRGYGAPGMMPQVDPSLALGLGAVATSGVLQGDSALTSGFRAELARKEPACVGSNFLQWPYMWSPLAWGSPWKVAWNWASVNSNNQHFQSLAKEKQGSLCYPKTLRMDRPDEAAYRSILNTLGIAMPPHTTAGCFNAFQPKADVFQPKMTTPQVPLEHSERSPPHVNPAAQARSIAFQEGS